MSEYICLLFTCLAAGGTIIGWYYYKVKHRSFHKKIRDIKELHEHELKNVTLDTREQTLQEVSRDIHDNISLGLTLSKLHLHTLNESSSPAFQNKLDLSIQLIGEVIHNLNNISKSLNADVIREFGLIGSIENEIDNLKQLKLFEIIFDCEGVEQRHCSRIEISFFRIFQEAIKNIIRHASATRIEILLTFKKDVVSLSITDNGKGFSVDEKRKPGGSGLKNMRERAIMIGGDFKVESIIDKRTTINISAPLNLKDEKRTTTHGK